MLVLVAVLAIMVPADETAARTALSAAQQAAVAPGAATLGRPEERRMANRWSDAKKIAEFLCRPAALTVLRKQRKDSDRVFLGIDPRYDLTLSSDRQLSGTGSVRAAAGWRDFRFTCGLDPKTGRVISFQPEWATPGFR